MAELGGSPFAEGRPAAQPEGRLEGAGSAAGARAAAGWAAAAPRQESQVGRQFRCCALAACAAAVVGWGVWRLGAMHLTCLQKTIVSPPSLFCLLLGSTRSPCL